MPTYLLDTDVGTDVDDALAIAYLASRRDIELVGVTSVQGNAPLRAEIARRLLAAADREVDVVAGRSRPLRASAVEDFHWNELWGHEGVGLVPGAQDFGPDPSPERDDAAEFIIESARRYTDLTLITIGPLSNLGRALQLDPDLGSRLHRVVMMGGLVERHKVGWGAQFETNFNADPLAAEIVLGSSLAMTMVPLEVTLQVFLGRSELDRLATSSRVLPAILLRLIEEMRPPFRRFNMRYGLEGSDFDGRVYLHDPLAVEIALGAPHATLRSAEIAVGWEGKALRTLEVEEGGRTMNVCFAVDPAGAVEDWVLTVAG